MIFMLCLYILLGRYPTPRERFSEQLLHSTVLGRDDRLSEYRPTVPFLSLHLCYVYILLSGGWITFSKKLQPYINHLKNIKQLW